MHGHIYFAAILCMDIGHIYLGAILSKDIYLWRQDYARISIIGGKILHGHIYIYLRARLCVTIFQIETNSKMSHFKHRKCSSRDIYPSLHSITQYFAPKPMKQYSHIFFHDRNVAVKV